VRLEDFDTVGSYTLRIDGLIHKYNFAVENASERKITKEEHTFLYLHGLPESWVLEIGFARWEADKVWDKPSDD
jgi:hypothetical protein